MSLSLKIVAFKGEPYSLDEAVTIDCAGGTIGRSDENTLVLPDPEKFVSRRHATITFADGRYTLSDSSLSGTYIDGEEAPLANASRLLTDGMRLKIGEYEIQVAIGVEQNPDELIADPFAPFLPASQHEHGILDSASVLTSDSLLDHFEHHDDLLDRLVSDNKSSLLSPSDGPFRASEGAEDFSGILQERIPSIHDSFIPAAPVSDPSADSTIPDDFNFEDLFADTDSLEASKNNDSPTIEAQPSADLPADSGMDELFPDHGDDRAYGREKVAGRTKTAALTAESAVVPRPAPTSEQALFDAFLQGAGMHSKDFAYDSSAETMQLIGAMFRHLVEGTVAVLRSRSEFKNQFRVTMTTIKTRDNNPLKFAVTADDALIHLLDNGQGGFKKSLAAIDEGFTDIASHQMAMQAGIQAALSELFGKFDPKLIEKQFEEGLVLQKKSKCWDKYVKAFPAIVEQTTENFFGEAFAEAYEKQMKRFSGTGSEK